MLKRENPLVILGYHGLCEDPAHHLNDFCFLSVEKFKQDLESVQACGWKMIDLSTAIHKLKNRSLEQPSVAITFDDGFRSSLHYAEPLLKKHEAHATVFLPTNLQQRRRPPWFTDIIHAVTNSNRQHFEFYGRRFYLTDDKQKQITSQFIQSFLKELHPKAIRLIVGKLYADLDVDLPNHNPEHQLASPEECRQALSRGYFDFGAHSSNHWIHSKLSRNELENEIAESTATLQELLQRKRILYAYPNGRRCDFTSTCIETLKKHNVEAALTTIQGWNRRSTHPYALRRFCVGSETRVDTILRSTLWNVLSYLG